MLAVHKYEIVQLSPAECRLKSPHVVIRLRRHMLGKVSSLANTRLHVSFALAAAASVTAHASVQGGETLH